MYDVTASRLFSVGSEDTILMVFLATSFLFYVARSQIGGPKHEKHRLQELFGVPQKHLHRTGAPPTLQTTSRNICEVISASSDIGAVVFWASQGGSAEVLASRYASELSSMLSKRGMTADLSDYDHAYLPDLPTEILLAFLVSTYGEGDPPDNGVALLESLIELREQGRGLSNVRYVMFGLGNSNYNHYNKYAFDIDRLLLEMGATRLGALGLGDDREGGTEESFLTWKYETSQQLAKELQLGLVHKTYSPRIRIRPVANGNRGTASGLSSSVYTGEPAISKPTSTLSQVVTLPITAARQLVLGEGRGGNPTSRHCVHLEFSLESCPSVTYETGDYICIWAMNPDEEVMALLKVFGAWDTRKDVVEIEAMNGAASSSIPVPTPTTMETLFRYYLDICGPISREFLQGLSEFILDTTMKHRLQAIADDRDVFHTEVVSKRLTLAGFLKGLIMTPSDATRPQASLGIPLSYVLEKLKRMKPRSYSISSSSLVEPRSIAVTCLAVVDPPQVLSTDSYRFRGVASNYLLQLQQESNQSSAEWQTPVGHYSTAGPRGLLHGGKVFARIRRSNFKLPPDTSTPIILIGSGTGVAPFRAFVQERMKQKMQGSRIGKTILLVGHRDPAEDFYYRDLWREAKDCLGEDFHLFTAFSRSNQQPRQYVQDVLATKSDLVLGVLTADQPSGGTMYVCGSSLMAKAVKTCLAQMRSHSLQQMSASSPKDAADEWIKELGRSRRLQEDSWG